MGALVGYALAGSIRVAWRTREAVLTGPMALQSALISVLLLVPGGGTRVTGAAFIGAMGGTATEQFITLMQINTPTALLSRKQRIASTISAMIMTLGMAQAGIVIHLTGENIPLMHSIPPGETVLVTARGLFSLRFSEFMRSQGLQPEPVSGAR